VRFLVFLPKNIKTILYQFDYHKFNAFDALKLSFDNQTDIISPRSNISTNNDS